MEKGGRPIVKPNGKCLNFFHFLDSYPYCQFSSNERIYLSNSQSKEEKPHFFNPTCASFKRCTISGSDRQTRLINVKIGHGSDTNLTCVFWEILHELKSLQTVLSCHSYNPFCGLRITRRMEGDNKVNVIYCTVSNKTTREGNLLRKLNENALFHIAADRSLQTQLLWSWVPKKLIKFTFSIWYLVQKSD